MECKPLTFLIGPCQKIISIDNVKQLVKEGCALGNSGRKVRALGKEVVRISVTVWLRALIEAVWAKDDARDLLVTYSSAVRALCERFKACGKAEVGPIAEITPSVCEVVAVHFGEIASPPRDST